MMKPKSLSAAQLLYNIALKYSVLLNIASHLEALGVSQPLIIWFLLVLIISQSSQGFSLVKCLSNVFLNIVCC